MISGSKNTEYLFTILVTATLGFIGYKQSLLVNTVKNLANETEKLIIEVPTGDLPSSSKSNIHRFGDETYCGYAPVGRVYAKFFNNNQKMTVKMKGFCNEKKDDLLAKGFYSIESGVFYINLTSSTDWKEVSAVKNFKFDSNNVVKSFTVHGYEYTKELCYDDKFKCKN